MPSQDLDIDIGELRHRVTWMTTPVLPRDKLNQSNKVPVSMGTFWAKVEPLSGMELNNARQLKGETSHKITIRDVGPVNVEDFFLFEGTSRAFNVTSVFRFAEMNAFLILHCIEQKVPS